MLGPVRIPFAGRHQFVAGEHDELALVHLRYQCVFLPAREQLQVVSFVMSDMSLNVVLPQCARGQCLLIADEPPGCDHSAMIRR